MKIIHVITRLDKGGSAEDTTVLVRELCRRGHQVVLVRGLSEESHMTDVESRALRDSVEAAREAGAVFVDLPPLLRRVSPLNDLKAFFALYLLFRQQEPDIVHTHTSKAGIVGRLAALFARVPVIIHTPHGHIFHGYFSPMVATIFILMERVAAWFTDCLVAVSDREREETLAQKIGSPEKIITAYSAVDLARFMTGEVDVAAKRLELGVPVGSQVVGTIGRLEGVKGHEYLLAASRQVVSQFPQTIFLLVGEGGLRRELMEIARSLGVSEHVLFMGWRPDIDEVLATFDIFALPSINEGMGKVLVEAMAEGKPIVASRVGGIVDLVKDGVNGLLVPPAEPEPLAAAILKLLGDRELAASFGRNGRDMVWPDFDISTRVDRIEMMYRSLVAKCKYSASQPE